MELKFGVSDWGLIEIIEDVWVNPRHIVSVTPGSVGDAQIQTVTGDVIRVHGYDVAGCIKRIAKLTMPMIYNEDIYPDPELVKKMIGQGG